MGCGSSVEQGRDEEAKNIAQQLDLDHGHMSEALIASPMAKRMESKYPWEDMEPLPEDVTVVFVLGGPGSGKSTQCKKLVELFGYTHLVTGDLLRREVETGTAIGKWANDLMSHGKLVPNQLSITLLKKAMISASNPMMLIDGFPRSMDQVGLCEKGISKAHAVLYFDVTEELARERRLASGASADTFSSVYNTFKEQNLPVKDHFIKRGTCHVIDAAQDPDVIFQEVKVIFERLEEQRKVEIEQQAADDKARREAEEAGEWEEEEEDASYDIVKPEVPAEQHSAAPAIKAISTPSQETVPIEGPGENAASMELTSTETAAEQLPDVRDEAVAQHTAP